MSIALESNEVQMQKLRERLRLMGSPRVPFTIKSERN